MRFVGFTGHKNPMIHLRMLELADQHNVQFDTVKYDAAVGREQHGFPSIEELPA